LKIHAASVAKHGDIDYDAVVKLCDGFNGADLRNVCTEAGMVSSHTLSLRFVSAVCLSFVFAYL
jgi:ATP-dependent 26S proteasome regulatory subunit